MGMSPVMEQSIGVALPGSGAVLAPPASVPTSVSGRDSSPAEPAYMCTRRLALRVEFVRQIGPVPGWEESQRATCVALGLRVLAEAERQGLKLTLWADWEWKCDPSGHYWLVQWQTVAVPVRDNTIDRFARVAQDAILTPAVGCDHVTRALAMALSGTTSITG